MRLVLAAALAATLAFAGTAAAADRLAVDASNVKLAVSRDGKTALVTFTTGGRVKHVLVWGAVNALPPSRAVPQVRFELDFSGGWGTQHKLVWKTFGNACRPYDGVPLDQLVAACKAPDGSYWALQQWQPGLPHRGFPPWKAGQTDWELDVSHWTGQPAQLEVHADWAFGKAHDLFGRLLYHGAPVHGFSTTRGGAPGDRYGRSLFIDTLNSAYGPGWKRETSIVFRNPTGVFCYSFWPTSDAALPGRPSRPAGTGAAYRIEVLGPGVTPNLEAEVKDPGDYSPSDPAKVALEKQMNQRLLELAQGDKFCPTQL